MSAMPNPARTTLLVIRDGTAFIPGWKWDSTQPTILGIPVRADANAAIPMIPRGETISPSLYLTFTNGWVLALGLLFGDLASVFPDAPLFPASTYIGEANRVFDLASFRHLDFVRDLAILEAEIREVGGQPPWAPDDLISQYIETDRYGVGIADAEIAEAGVPVWALVGAVMLTDASPGEVAEDYELPVAAVHAALAFYQRYRPIIDARITANIVGVA